MDYDKKSTPEIRMAPTTRAINPDKIPKRPNETMQNYYDMPNEQLMAIVTASLLGLPAEKTKYRSDPKYKAEVDWIYFTGMIAMATLFLREECKFNIDQYLKDNKDRWSDFIKKWNITSSIMKA